jgi:urea transport system permease protein
MDVLLNIVGATGSTLLVVLGLSLILGLMGIINLAQTGFMAVAVYLGISLTKSGIGFWPAAAIATLGTGALGLVVEMTVIRRLYGKPLETMLATWGISLMIVQAITMIYGAGAQNMAVPVSGSVSILGATYPVYRLVLFGVAIGLIAVLGAISRFTHLGLIVRMVMANDDLARGVGIDTERVKRATFVIGCALSGLAGILIGPISGISPNYASAILVPSFLAVLLSGRTLAGTVIACVALSVVQVCFAQFVDPSYAVVVTIVAAVVLLRIAPDGLRLPKRVLS